MDDVRGKFSIFYPIYSQKLILQSLHVKITMLNNMKKIVDKWRVQSISHKLENFV